MGIGIFPRDQERIFERAIPRIMAVLDLMALVLVLA